MSPGLFLREEEQELGTLVAGIRKQDTVRLGRRSLGVERLVSKRKSVGPTPTLELWPNQTNHSGGESSTYPWVQRRATVDDRLDGEVGKAALLSAGTS